MSIPWELEEEIAKEACNSLSGIFVVRRVCHRWKKIANRMHRARINYLHSALLHTYYDGQNTNEIFSRLIVNSAYRREKVRKWCKSQRQEFIKSKITEYLVGDLRGFVVGECSPAWFFLSKDKWDMLVGAGIYNIRKNLHAMRSEDCCEALGVNRNTLLNLGTRYFDIQEKCLEYEVFKS